MTDLLNQKGNSFLIKSNVQLYCYHGKKKLSIAANYFCIKDKKVTKALVGE